MQGCEFAFKLIISDQSQICILSPPCQVPSGYFNCWFGDPGEPVVLLMELLQLVRGMKFLAGPWLMFNAFIFALLK